MESENLILYDWFSFTTKYYDLDYIAQLLGMDLAIFRPRKGARGYHEGLAFGGINLLFGGKEEIWCEMSGQGCRSFETHGHGAWDTLFMETMTDQYHITRLDVAFDDHTGLLDLNVLAEDTRDKKNIVTEFRYWEAIESSKGMTIILGSPSSNQFFRIYDKARERGVEDEGHWVRFEIQMRDDYAFRFLSLMTLRTVGETFVGVVSKNVRYVRQVGDDANKRRWPLADYWANFIGTAEKLSLYQTPGTEYNLDKLERYAIKQAGASAATYIEIVGLDRYLEQINAELERSLNPNYFNLIQQHKNKG